MSERAALSPIRMGVETDPELQRRMEVAALGWRLQNGAYDRDRTVADLLGDADATAKRLREAEALTFDAT